MFYLILASIVWPFSYGLMKTELSHLDPNWVTFVRMFFALPVFLPFLEVRRISEWEKIYLMGIGAIQYGLMYLFFIRSFQYINAYQAAFFTVFTPFYVILFHDVLSRQWEPRHIIMAALAVVGGALACHEYCPDGQLWVGCGLVQAADLCFALGQILYKRFRMTRPTLSDQSIYAWLFIGALFIAALATTWTQGWNSFQMTTIPQWYTLFYLGSIASGICFFWWNKGAVHIDASTLAVMNNLKAPLAIVISVLFFHEEANLFWLILGLFVLFYALTWRVPKRLTRLHHA